MNTNRTSSLTGRPLTILLTLAGLSAASAFAGPGPQYWLIERSARSNSASTPLASERCRACSDTKVVEATETKPSWVNGRGPLVTTKKPHPDVCPNCSVQMAVRKSEWRNGRGPLAPVAVPTADQLPVATSATNRRG